MIETLRSWKTRLLDRQAKILGLLLLRYPHGVIPAGSCAADLPLIPGTGNLRAARNR